MRYLIKAFLIILALLCEPSLANAAAPSYVSAIETSGANTATFPITYPASPVSGDYAIYSVMTFVNGGLSIVSAPLGFTQIAVSGASCCAERFLYYKKLDGTEIGAATLTLSGASGNNNSWVGSISYWHGVQQTGTPYEQFGANAAAGTAAGTATSVTTTGTDETLVTFWTMVNTGGTAAIGSSPSSGWTNAYGTDMAKPIDGWQQGNRTDYQVKSTAGTVAAETRTFAYAQGVWNVYTIALFSGAAAVTVGHNGSLLGVGN